MNRSRVSAGRGGEKAYARAGVDVDLGNAVKSRIHYRVKVTHGPEVLGKVGGFGGLFRPDFRGMREPVPVYCKTTAAWAKGAVAKRQALAAKQWTSEWGSPREDKDPEHMEVLGGVVPFAQLLEELPRQDESGEGWDEGEETRFGRYARRLWSGLLTYEKVTDQ